MVEDILRVFPDARVQSGYVRVRCPYHKGGHEERPSMSILLEPRGNAPKGLCHCFACGKKVMIDKLFYDLGEHIDFDPENQTLLSYKVPTLTTTTPLMKTQLPFRKSEYLESRGISEEVQKRFKIYEKDKKVHMPVFNREGFYVYDNARSTVDKRFFIESGAVKSLWGIEEIDLSKPIAVCESQIDALSLWEAGVQAVATLGADNITALKMISKSTSFFILAFDPDDAGRRARDRAANMLGKYRCRWLNLPEGIDVNQALQDIKDVKKFKAFMLRCMEEFVQ